MLFLAVVLISGGADHASDFSPLSGEPAPGTNVSRLLTPTPLGEPPGGRRWNDRRVHDPSTIVKCQDDYWLFATGPGIISRRSKNLVQWEPGPRVFSRMPAWTTNVVPDHRGFFWAPDVISLHGRLPPLLLGVELGQEPVRDRLARASTLDPADPRFGWTDEGIVVQSWATNDFNAIDPGVHLEADGRLWLAFGSFWSGIKLIELDPATGRRRAPDSPMHALASHAQIEAPCLVSRERYHYLFVNWGACCRGTNSTYEIRVGRSPSVTGPYLDRAGKDLCAEGGSAFLGTEGRWVGPGHAGVFREGQHTWLSCHFYDGERDGMATLAVRRLEWDADGWPVAGAMVSARGGLSRRDALRLKSAHRFMGSALFLSDLLTGHEPGRDAFHRVPIFSGEFRDAVECVPTGLNGRFMGSCAIGVDRASAWLRGKELAHGGHVEHAVRGHGRAADRAAQIDLAEQLLLLAGGKDQELAAARGEIDLAVGHQRRSPDLAFHVVGPAACRSRRRRSGGGGRNRRRTPAHPRSPACTCCAAPADRTRPGRSS